MDLFFLLYNNSLFDVIKENDVEISEDFSF